MDYLTLSLGLRLTLTSFRMSETRIIEVLDGVGGEGTVCWVRTRVRVWVRMRVRVWTELVIRGWFVEY